MSNITLIGMPGSGKSTVGVLLAKALGRGFLDTDLVIQQQENALLQDILDRRGVSYFLDAEERAVRSVCCDHYVIAPGGSVVCREGAINHLKSMGPVIYLRVPLDEPEVPHPQSGLQRDRSGTRADIGRHPHSPCPLYEQYADWVVDALPGQELAQTVSHVLALLEKGLP